MEDVSGLCITSCEYSETLNSNILRATCKMNPTQMSHCGSVYFDKMFKTMIIEAKQKLKEKVNEYRHIGEGVPRKLFSKVISYDYLPCISCCKKKRNNF